MSSEYLCQAGINYCGRFGGPCREDESRAKGARDRRAGLTLSSGSAKKKWRGLGLASAGRHCRRDVARHCRQRQETAAGCRPERERRGSSVNIAGTEGGSGRIGALRWSPTAAYASRSRSARLHPTAAYALRSAERSDFPPPPPMRGENERRPSSLRRLRVKA